jgi:hypothetical protein
MPGISESQQADRHRHSSGNSSKLKIVRQDGRRKYGETPGFKSANGCLE